MLTAWVQYLDKDFLLLFLNGLSLGILHPGPSYMGLLVVFTSNLGVYFGEEKFGP